MATAPHAVIIGSGFGGLAAAVRLAARGYRVTVCEQLDAPGGRAYVFRQDGFVFDGGPTIVTAPFLFEDLWSLAGRRMADDVDLKALHPFYRIRFDDGSCFDYSGDPEAMAREVARIAPKDVGGYERFMAASRRLFEVGFEELLHVPFHPPALMLKVLPNLMRTQAYRSVFGMVSRYFSHPKLRMVFSFHPLLIGGNPLSTTAIYALIAHLERSYGVHYVMGGTGALVNAMVRLGESLGATLRLNSPVDEILVRDDRVTGVRLGDGTELLADVVVSNADAAATYRDLLPARYRRRWRDERLARTRYSMSLFVWYFGTNRRYPDVPHHQILLGPRYQGLLKDIFDRKILADDFSLYLHRPTATDPSLAPEGCEAFYVLSPVPNLRADVDWQVQAEPYRAAIAAHLAATVLPGLSDAIATSRLLTPLDFRDRLSSVEGAAFSMEPVLTQTAWFRPHNRSEEVEGLYLVGAGTHPGAGLPGVVSSARVLDSVVPDP